MNAARRRQLRALAIVGALGMIGAATLTPQLPNPHPLPWYQPFAGGGDLADILLNLGLFVPLGVALGVSRVRRRRAVAVALATTIVVELLQAFVVPGRQASVADVVTNTLGGWLGHVVALATLRAWRADAAHARRLAAAYATGWLLATVAMAALLRPSLPATDAYRARCGVRDLPDCFPGQLASPPRLRQAGRPDVAIVQGVRTDVARDAWLEADLVDGGMAYVPGRIGGIATTPGGALMILEQRADWLLFNARTRGATWGLRSPNVVLRGVLGRPGQPVRVAAGVTGNVRWLEARGRRAQLWLSAAEGWRLFFPWSALRGAVITTVGAIFHAISLLPLGFWVARAMDDGRRATSAATTMMAAALAFVPVAAAFAGGGLALDLGPVRATDWMGAAAGVAAGALLARGRAERGGDDPIPSDLA